jgi:hypothetical protein
VTEGPEIAAARLEVERRRSRVMATAHELQDRLSPKALARNTWQGAKEKGADIAEDAGEPLFDLAGKLVDGAKGKSRKRRKPAQNKAERAPQKQKTEATE